MSDTDDHSDDRALAGEYVLGLLSEPERAAFETRLGTAPALRALVRAWHEDLAHLSDEVAPVAPPAHLQRQIEAGIFGAPAGHGRLAGLPTWLWGGLTAAVLVGALILGGDVLNRGPRMPTDPAYVAEIAAADRSLILRAAFDEGTGTLHLDTERGAPRPGRVIELWLIAGGAAPVSLGVMPDRGHMVVDLAEPLRAVLQGAVLAVSDEPPGGSRTGAPTGDVLAVGEITDT